jgi:hypothetical protein
VVTNFIRWRLIFMGPHGRNCFMSSFWDLAFLEVNPKFLENLCTPDVNLHRTNRSLRECPVFDISDMSLQVGMYIKRIKNSGSSS